MGLLWHQSHVLETKERDEWDKKKRDVLLTSSWAQVGTFLWKGLFVGIQLRKGLRRQVTWSRVFGERVGKNRGRSSALRVERSFQCPTVGGGEKSYQFLWQEGVHRWLVFLGNKGHLPSVCIDYARRMINLTFKIKRETGGILQTNKIYSSVSFSGNPSTGWNEISRHQGLHSSFGTVGSVSDQFLVK